MHTSHIHIILLCIVSEHIIIDSVKSHLRVLTNSHKAGSQPTNDNNYEPSLGAIHESTNSLHSSATPIIKPGHNYNTDEDASILPSDKIIQQHVNQEQIESGVPPGFVPISTVSKKPTFTTQQSISTSTKQRRKFYMSGGSPRASGAVPLTNTFSWSEQFFSQDDESISVSNASGSKHSSIHNKSSFPSIGVGSSTSNKFDPIIEVTPPDDTDETCNDTAIEKVRQRSKKASRASNVAAFVTFLKALFGIGMLSNPAVLGEVGLVLGTFCHLFIVVGCAFSCYLLLAARQLAKLEIQTKQKRDDERRVTYEMWRLENEQRAAAAAAAISSGQQQHQQQEATSSSEQQPTDIAVVQGVNTAESNLTAGSWSIAPVALTSIPFERVKTSKIAPKEGWGRCEDAIHTVSGKDCNYSVAASPNRFAATPSCGNVQMIRQPSTKRSKRKITDEYQRFTDNIHTNYMPPPPMPTTQSRAPTNKLITYGDVAKYLAGKRASFFIIFTIVVVHLMFASGMIHLAIENLCYVFGWERLGWSYVTYEYDDDDNVRHRRLPGSEDEDRASRSSDEEEYYLEWKGPDFVGRLAMASLLFPIIQGLLQIPTLTELATISSVGLLTYAVGCVGSMMYTAFILTEGHPFSDRPDNMWKAKWSGIPTYVATTIYCIEGINLALPTVSSIEGNQRWGGGGISRSQNGSGVSKETQDSSVFIVVGAVFLYGIVTLVISWAGLAGGLGGGTGTMHGKDGCWDVTYCLNSSSVRFIYMLSLGIALVFTVPVILYPSTEMLEVWLDERKDEREKAEAVATMRRSRLPPPGRRSEAIKLREKSILPEDDDTVDTMTELQSPSALGINTQQDIELRDMSCSPGDVGGYTAPSCAPEPSPQSNQDDTAQPTTTAKPENSKKAKAKRKLKYWKLRMFLAATICIIGTLEGSFPSILKAAEVIRGIGLSIAGLIFPPLLYMSAVGGNFSVPMATAMALLIGLGMFNIVLVLMSAFGSKDYIREEGRNQFYDL